MIDAAKRASARTVNIIMPYYGYARQERKAAPREPISAKMVADVLTTVGADRVITIDLHAPAIQGFFEYPCGSSDGAGFHQRLLKPKYQEPGRRFAGCWTSFYGGEAGEYLDSPFAIMIKKRLAHNESIITHVIGDVEGQTPIIIEDLIDTGTTIVNVVEGLEGTRAEDVYVCATHRLFSANAIEKLTHPNIRQVVVTDTIALSDHSDKFFVLPMSPLIATAIKIISEGGSLDKLFKIGG